MKRATAGLGLAAILIALLGTSALAGVDKKIHTEQATAEAQYFEEFEKYNIRISASADGLVTAFITEDGAFTRCRTYDGDVRVSPRRARVKATLDDCWLGTGPITVDLRWKPIAKTDRIHIDEWDPTKGCGNPPQGWTAHHIFNRWMTDATASGFVDGKPFKSHTPAAYQWGTNIDVSMNRMTCCGECPDWWPT